MCSTCNASIDACIGLSYDSEFSQKENQEITNACRMRCLSLQDSKKLVLRFSRERLMAGYVTKCEGERSCVLITYDICFQDSKKKLELASARCLYVTDRLSTDGT